MFKRGQIVYVKQHSQVIQWVRTKVEGFGDGFLFVTLNNKRTAVHVSFVMSAREFRGMKVM